MLGAAKASSLVLALLAVPALAAQVDSHGNLIRRSSASHMQMARGKKGGDKTNSASNAQYTTINGKSYPKDLSADAPAPVLTDNSWLQEVQQNDTQKHSFKYNAQPKTSEQGQKGINNCKKGSTSGQDSLCQTAILNSAEDFCLWAPPDPNTSISVSEQYEVAWCTKDHGTRLIPQGTLTGVHFVKTDSYVQVTGTGDFTKINIKDGDQGGELDPHGATGDGNPIGGLVYTTAFSNGGKKHEQINEWMQEISATQFCFRGCKGTDYKAQMLCSHIYDEMGCDWLMPANYTQNIFEDCEGEPAPAPGIIGTYTFTQGDPVTPSPRNAPQSSNCQNAASPTGPAPTGAAATSSAGNSSSGSSGSGSGSGGGVHTLAQKAVSSTSSEGGSSSSTSAAHGHLSAPRLLAAGAVIAGVGAIFTL